MFFFHNKGVASAMAAGESGAFPATATRRRTSRTTYGFNQLDRAEGKDKQ
ncbi:MAG: hypothetical protein H6Q41_3294 [Deltaproteobacteria bacterium]|nr:hypothetical protein [Deltaproteobacteria bacterium]